MVKIAYHMCFHKNQYQCLNLLDTLYTEDDAYLIHVDSKADASLMGAILKWKEDVGGDNVCFQTRMNAGWGTYTLYMMYFGGVKRLLDFSSDWTHYMNLSGQDYPIKPIHHIKKALDSNNDKSYVEVRSPSEWSEITKRIEMYFWPRKNGGFINTRIPRKPNREYDFYGGSAWGIFSRSFCEYVAQSDSAEDLAKFFKYSRNSSELFFQTILMNSQFKDSFINDDKHFIKWIDNSGHPGVITVEDVDQMINSDKWFARKFDSTVDGEVLKILRDRLKNQA